MSRGNRTLKTKNQTLKLRKEDHRTRQPSRSVSLKTQMAQYAVQSQRQEKQTAEGDATDHAASAAGQAVHKAAIAPQIARQRMIRQAQTEKHKEAQQKKETETRSTYREKTTASWPTSPDAAEPTPTANPQPQAETDPPLAHTGQTAPSTSHATFSMQRQPAPEHGSQPTAEGKPAPQSAYKNPTEASKQAYVRSERVKSAKKSSKENPTRIRRREVAHAEQEARRIDQPKQAQRRIAWINDVVKSDQPGPAELRTRDVIESEHQAEIANQPAQSRYRQEGSSLLRRRTQRAELRTKGVVQAERREAMAGPPKQAQRRKSWINSVVTRNKTRRNMRTASESAMEPDGQGTSVTPPKEATSSNAHANTAPPLKQIGQRTSHTAVSPASVMKQESHAVMPHGESAPVSANAKTATEPGQAMKRASRIRESMTASAAKSGRVREAVGTELKTSSVIPAKSTRQTRRTGTMAAEQAAAKRGRVQAQKVLSAKAAAAKQAVKKRTIAAVKATVQAAAKAVKSMAGSIAGAGAGVLAPLIVIILLGALLCGPLGLFFTGEADNEMTLQQAMTQLNTEFSDRISEIEDSVPHDDVRQEGHRAIWKDILTVYAVRATTDTNISLDVVTMDENHLEVLREIFWDMNAIDYTTESYTDYVSVEVEVEDEDGGTHTETQIQSVSRTRLVILITGKTAVDMATEYNFTQEQINLVSELLSDEYTEFWSMMSVPGVGSNDIVEVALSQLGNVGGYPYWSWYGFSYRVSWCACYVSWCADQCGYIDAGIIPRHSLVDDGIYWFQVRGQWQDRYYLPSPGDIIYFDWQPNGYADHVGIVEYCDGFYVHTIEGNSGDACRQQVYAVGSNCIFGYGVPLY